MQRVFAHGNNMEYDTLFPSSYNNYYTFATVFNTLPNAYYHDDNLHCMTWFLGRLCFPLCMSCFMSGELVVCQHDLVNRDHSTACVFTIIMALGAATIDYIRGGIVPLSVICHFSQ